MKTRILIADDHAMLREGLRNLLVQEKDFELVGEAPDGATGGGDEGTPA